VSDTTQHPIVIAEQRRRAFTRGMWTLSAVLVAAFVFHTCDAGAAARTTTTPATTATTGGAASLRVCEHLIGDLLGKPDGPSRLGVCVEVAAHARRLGVPVRLALALAWREGKFVRVFGRRSIVSTLQCSTRWFQCPGAKGDRCDDVVRCMAGLARIWEDEGGDCVETVARWNGGPAWRTVKAASGGWARGVCALRRRLERVR
jgi:hypothetical protein